MRFMPFMKVLSVANSKILRNCKGRFESSASFVIQKPAPFVEFDHVLRDRRGEADRSIVVQVKTRESCADLLGYCRSRYGDVKTAFYYVTRRTMNCMLIEFQEAESVDRVIKNGAHSTKGDVLPVRSPMLWFSSNIMESVAATAASEDFKEESLVYPTTDEMKNHLETCSDTFSRDMFLLYEKTKLNDLSVRLRFVASRQLETALKGFFPFAKVWPFGSSVNSFGKIGSDLDLVLQYDPFPNQDENNRLIFHAKSSVDENRNQVQRHLEIIADFLQHFLPGCHNVIRILNARVPILRYKQELVGLDCDLSSTNLTGLYMSELLYIFGSLDSRVRPLVFTVRYWAKEVNLTNPAPGRWITNFSLTLLVLFYLQTVKILPSIQDLVRLKRPEDDRIADGVDCSFLRDIARLTSNNDDEPRENDVSPFRLLFGFFEFYSAFDFGNLAVSLNAAAAIPKPEYSPLYVVNPLEKYLNVTRNVSQDECERLKIECRDAAWSIENAVNECLDEEGDKGKRRKNFRLMDLMKMSVAAGCKRNGRLTHFNIDRERMMSIKELFEQEDEEEYQPKGNMDNFNSNNNNNNNKIKSRINNRKRFKDFDR